jgi:hypothetical protein
MALEALAPIAVPTPDSTARRRRGSVAERKLRKRKCSPAINSKPRASFSTGLR